MGCSLAQEVLTGSCLWPILEPFVHVAEGFAEIMFTLLDTLDKGSMAQLAMTVWMIRWRRNKKCWKDHLPSTFISVQRKSWMTGFSAEIKLGLSLIMLHTIQIISS